MTQFRIYLDDRPAPPEFMDAIASVVVEQEIDLAWEARIEIPDCQNDAGEWSKATQLGLADIARVRIEVKVADTFEALIDGPVVGADGDLDSEPGQSAQILRVHDDSVLLNRDIEPTRWENKTDSEIADAIFARYPALTTRRVDPTPTPSGRRPPEVAQNESDIQLLRELARRHPHFHAYVLPGPTPSASVACFNAVGQSDRTLPEMVLTGAGRNISSFSARADRNLPARVVVGTFDVANRQETGAEATAEDFRRFADTFDLGGQEPRTVTIRPESGEAVDSQTLVDAEAARRAWQVEASGSVLGHCYGGVLRPYDLVTVQGAGRNSGQYLIKAVRHALDDSTYGQEFTLLRDGISSSSGGGGGVPAGIM
ncbi:MAG: hypothetical protein RIT81_16475 [Deltaproteobacteria bacterium]